MKNACLSIILLVATLTSLNARNVVEDALLKDTEYTLLGTFGQHDFADTPYALDWAFTMLSTGKSYQLQGGKPTKDDVFGWKEVSIKAPTPVWFMFRLNGDVDGDGSTKYDWIVASADTNIAASYKLAGVSNSGNFKYSSKLNLNYKINNNKIQIYAIGSSVTPVPTDVTDSAKEEAAIVEAVTPVPTDVTDSAKEEAAIVEAVTPVPTDVTDSAKEEAAIVEAVTPVPIVATDTTAPVIVLNGAASMTIIQGEIFNDPGAKATDDIDGSVEIKVDGVVNTQLPGTYTLIYSAMDSMENKVSITRKIIVTDSKYSRNEKGLFIYAQNLLPASYKLNQLTNDEFNALSDAQKLRVADKLLSTLFFGYPLKILEEKISSGSFIDDIKKGLSEEKTDKVLVERYISDVNKFEKRKYGHEVNKILSRFYAMDKLDSYFLQNWMAYLLTQTVMFSPASELNSSSNFNIESLYNRLVTSFGKEKGMRYITYEHMKSEENWRRFRSPEDNGREMLEIFLLDMDDSHVPIAAKALKNWKLQGEAAYSKLVISSNENTDALQLFGKTFYNGDDFYRELTKSTLFSKGVTSRIVDFLFSNATKSKKDEIINMITLSKPETWQDIFLQIIFSKEYLLHSNRAKSAEEMFFSLTKKMDYKHIKKTFNNFHYHLRIMNQASMKYKLGKLSRVPLDTLSFARYHYFTRTFLLLKRSDPKYINNFGAWEREGWSDSFVSDDNFEYNSTNIIASLNSLIHYLFKTTIARLATADELQFFQEHMLQDKQAFNHYYNIFALYEDKEKQKRVRIDRRRNIVFTALDYISRLDTLYLLAKVK